MTGDRFIEHDCPDCGQHSVADTHIAHDMSFPADTIGHHLLFIHPPERDYLRTAACTGCDFQAPAPGTGYSRGRQLHTKAHADLVAQAQTADEDRAGLLRGITLAIPAGLGMWAALGWAATRWW